MRVAYVGNFSQRHCTEVHIAATLEDLGHEVVRLQENELKRDWVTNLQHGVDLVLYTRTWGQYVTMGDLAELTSLHIPTASYHLDLYHGLERQAGIDTGPFWRTDVVFTPDGSPEAAAFFASKGINHHYIKPAVFRPECVNGDPRPELAHDVVFVGGGLEYAHPEWAYRRQLVRWLMDNYQGITTATSLETVDVPRSRFGKYGHPQPTMRNKDLNDLYASAKVVVGDSVCIDFSHSYYWSDRVYETIGRGGFIIHPYIKGMEEEFTDGQTIVFYNYGDFDGLRAKIDYYLDPTHADERERIRKAGQEFVREHATYHDRLRQMLNIVFPPPNTDVFGYGLHGDEGPAPELPEEALRINLGAGTDQFEGFVNVDMVDLPGIDVVHNLMTFPYPFEDESASEIKAVDVLEHLANYTADGRPGVVAFVEECHRILKPGGELYIQTPGWDADFLWEDPTHVRGFAVTSMDFFDPDTHYGRTTGFYSKATFSVRAEKLENCNLRFWMTKR